MRWFGAEVCAVLLLLTLVEPACSSSAPAPTDASAPLGDASVDAPQQPAPDSSSTVPDAATCRSAGSACDDPFKCCSMSCLIEVDGSVCAD